mmetsp:Transcript_605/g.856  ORF Transcript_605/g.856 Transcript_605/m.856 type:complete len:215 (+) Transcript_605:2-646(+)
MMMAFSNSNSNLFSLAVTIRLLCLVHRVQHTQAAFFSGVLSRSTFIKQEHDVATPYSRITPSTTISDTSKADPPFLTVAMSSSSSSSETEQMEEDLLASTLRSMTFANLDKDKEPQLLVEFLMEVGACSTAITDADRDTPQEQALYSEPGDDPWARQNAAIICGDAAVGTNVWNRCNVTAHFPASFDLKGIATMVEECLDIPLEFNVEHVPDRD